jgi:hypothetical protein
MLILIPLRTLDLMIPLNHIRISRRWSRWPTLTPLSQLPPGHTILRLCASVVLRLREHKSTLLTGELSSRRLASTHSTIVLLSVDPLGARATVTLLVVQMLILVRIGVFKHDVPGVQKARENTEHAEADVDQGVCTADATFDPNYIFR